MKNSFVLYTDYQEQLELLTFEQRGVLFTAIMAYVSGRDLPQMDGMTNMCFAFIRQGLDRDREKYEKTCEARRAAGKLGGRPKANGLETLDGRSIPSGEIEGKHFLYLIYDTYENQYKIGETSNLFMRRYHIKRPTNHLEVVDYIVADKPDCIKYEKEVLTTYKQYSVGGDWFDIPEEKVEEIRSKWFSNKSNGYQKKQKVLKKPDNDSDNDSDNDNDNDSDISIGAKSKRFTPPTRQEVAEYIREKGYTVDADRFVDFYTSKGWMIGKNPMKDWKAAVRTWSRGNKEKTSKVSKFASYPQRDYDYSALEKALLGAQ